VASDDDLLHLELLLGARVHDSNGRMVGRIEEFRAEQVHGEWVVSEFHLGTAALLERLAIAVGRLPLISALPFGTRTIRCVRWDQMSFDRDHHPRVNVPREQLSTIVPD
jgi:hypothetical protein